MFPLTSSRETFKDSHFFCSFALLPKDQIFSLVLKQLFAIFLSDNEHAQKASSALNTKSDAREKRQLPLQGITLRSACKLSLLPSIA